MLLSNLFFASYIIFFYVRQFFVKEIDIGGSDSNINTYLIWGPPGSGKSTLQNKYPPNTIFKNLDDMVRFVCDYRIENNDSKKDLNYFECRNDPMRIQIDNYLDRLSIDQKKHVAIELTGNKLYNEEKWFQDIKKNWNKIIVYCMFVNSTDKLWNRISSRNQDSIEKNQVQEHCINAYVSNMQKLIDSEYIDEIHIYDNSGVEPTFLCSMVKKDGKVDTICKSDNPLQKSKNYQQWFLSKNKNKNISTMFKPVGKKNIK